MNARVAQEEDGMRFYNRQHTYYVCAAEGIPFVLGHALAMKAIHGGKAKNDKLDSFKIATLLRGGLLPQGWP
jgi:hypothetical protein